MIQFDGFSDDGKYYRKSAQGEYLVQTRDGQTSEITKSEWSAAKRRFEGKFKVKVTSERNHTNESKIS